MVEGVNGIIIVENGKFSVKHGGPYWCYETNDVEAKKIVFELFKRGPPAAYCDKCQQRIAPYSDDGAMEPVLGPSVDRLELGGQDALEFHWFSRQTCTRHGWLIPAKDVIGTCAGCEREITKHDLESGNTYYCKCGAQAHVKCCPAFKKCPKCELEGK